MKQLKIREATIEDAANIASLVNAAYRPQPGAEGWTHESGLVEGDRISPEQVRKTLIDSKILLGLHDSEIVACVQIEKKDDEAYIGMFAVAPSSQALGLGKIMLREAEKYAESSFGAVRLMLLVVSAQTDLLQFYLRRGYEETGQKVAYPVDKDVGKPRNGNLELTQLCKHVNT